VETKILGEAKDLKEAKVTKVVGVSKVDKAEEETEVPNGSMTLLRNITTPELGITPTFGGETNQWGNKTKVVNLLIDRGAKMIKVMEGTKAKVVNLSIDRGTKMIKVMEGTKATNNKGIKATKTKVTKATKATKIMVIKD
jgi:hypothetical protein